MPYQVRLQSGKISISRKIAISSKIAKHEKRSQIVERTKLVPSTSYQGVREVIMKKIRKIEPMVMEANSVTVPSGSS